MAITKKEDAVESGFAQVREALQSFEGDVVAADFDVWGTGGIGDDGKPLEPKEYFEIKCINVKVLTVKEELSMAITEWNFRVNCSAAKGSFWVDAFLDSADKAGVLIPEGIIGKRIRWTQRTMSWDIGGRKVDYTNFIIGEILGDSDSAPIKTPEAQQDVPVSPPVEDPMAIACDLAVGKTETQFRSAIALHLSFIGTPLLTLAKDGAITKTLVDQGMLKVVDEDGKEVYRKP